MNYRSMLIASGVGGLTMAVLSQLPVIQLGNCLGCMWLWGGGIFSVWFYRYLQGGASQLSIGEGTVIGVVSGFFGAIISFLIGTIFGGANIAAVLASRSDFIESMLGSLAVAGILSFLAFLFNIFIYPFFGAIGGAIGGVLFSPRDIVAGE
jgi:hypothetical protein